jgi:hypothetical protein
VAAVNAYAQSVALLSEVMERVRNGEDSTESNRRRQRRSISAQEKEVRRLQNIVSWFFIVTSTIALTSFNSSMIPTQIE